MQSKECESWEYHGTGGKMRVCLKECKDAELVRSSVPIARKNDIYENTQPEIEHCSDGIAPQPNTAVDGSQKMIAPVVVSMTKYLFAHYRLQMYRSVLPALYPNLRAEKRQPVYLWTNEL